MPRIAYCSDLHIHPEYRSHWPFSSLEALKTDADILLIAGDIGEPNTLKRVFDQIHGYYKNICWVLGNHDYVDLPRSEVFELCMEIEADYPNVTWLEDNYIDIDGVRIHGATLWYKAQPDPYFFDFMHIPQLEKWVTKSNQETLDYFLENVRPGDIIMTHHLPSWGSVARQWRNSNTNQFFVCPEMELVIEATQPAIHIHGHTHVPFDYNIRGTRILCNPRGYQNENSNWKMKVIDI